MSLIEFDLGATRHHLTRMEAGLLKDWLEMTRSWSAQSLAKSVGESVDATRPGPIRLGPDDIAALRSVLCQESLLGGLTGLEGLQTALCPEAKV